MGFILIVVHHLRKRRIESRNQNITFGLNHKMRSISEW